MANEIYKVTWWGTPTENWGNCYKENVNTELSDDDNE
jgi:hypothetical protein